MNRKISRIYWQCTLKAHNRGIAEKQWFYGISTSADSHWLRDYKVGNRSFLQTSVWIYHRPSTFIASMCFAPRFTNCRGDVAVQWKDFRCNGRSKAYIPQSWHIRIYNHRRIENNSGRLMYQVGFSLAYKKAIIWCKAWMQPFYFGWQCKKPFKLITFFDAHLVNKLLLLSFFLL